MMYRNFKRDICDPHAPYLPGYYGVFEQIVDVGGRQRRLLAYVPEDVRESTAGVLVLGENGKTADDLLRDSGWCDIADQEECKEKLIVFFLEPENGVWNLGEPYGKADGDVAYIDAAAQIATQRFLFCVHESKVYLTGCKEGGVLANMAAAWNPAFFAGVATVGGSAVAPAYLSAARADFCTNLDGFIDESHKKDIRKGDIPMPAWIIDDPETAIGTGEAILKHWCMACGTEPHPRQTDADCVEFFRVSTPPLSPNQEKEAFRVCHSSIPGASQHYARPFLRRIWKDFLYRQRRWMSGPGGDLRVTRDPVRDLGMEYHYEEVDGWMREWYVYIPTAVKANPGKKVPLVLALHGYTCSGEIYAGNSEWYKVADKYNFIVVHPSALHGYVSMPEHGLLPNWAPLPAWNIFQENDRPDELHFFNFLIDRMIADYPVDHSRIFATGHSWGSLMTQMLGLGMSNRLAAIAPCSGVFFGGASKRMLALPQLNNTAAPQLPIWMFWGTEEAWLIPAEPSHDNETGFTIKLWLKKNNMADLIPENWATCVPTKNGRFLDHIFERADAAPVWYTQVDYMPHATMTEMSFRIWEEFFSRFARKGDAIIDLKNSK